MLDQILKSGPSSRTSTTHALPHPDDRSSRPSDFPKPILRRASTSSVASSLRSPPHPRGISNDERVDPGLLEASLASRPRSKLLLQSPTATSTPTPEREKEKDETTRQSSPNRAPWRRRDGWRGWATESVGTSEMVPALVVQAFSTGILDATTYADFNTFASNQTGNTILLTVSIIGTIRVLLLLTGVSLASFLAGAFIFGHLGTFFGVRRRLWLLTSLTYQILTLVLSCILLSPSGPSLFQIGGKHDWFILLLFANMSGAQVVMARQSSCQELPTAPMTSSFVDLVADPYLFVGWRHEKAGPRNRRLVYVVVMVIGALSGAVMHRYAGSWVVVLVTVGLKCGVMGMLGCTSAKDQT